MEDKRSEKDLEMHDSSFSIDTTTETYTDVDLLNVHAGGICGILERVPMIVKLALLCGVSLLGMLVLATFLLVVESQAISVAKQTNHYIGLASTAGQYISVIQDEREASNLYMASNFTSHFSREMQLVLNSFRDTDKATQSMDSILSKFQSQDSFKDRISDFTQKKQKLNEMRTKAFNGTVTSSEIFEYYSSLIDSMLNILCRFVNSAGNSPLAISYSVLFRIIESEQQLRDVGIYLIIANKLTASTFKSFNQYLNTRDYLISQWKAIASDSLIDLYSETVAGEIISNLTDVESYFNGDRDCISCGTVGLYDLRTWDNYTATLINMLRIVKDETEDMVKRNSIAKFTSASALITIVVVIIAIFFSLSLASSLILSYTIVGPWRRLNIIQEAAIAKFVPLGFLRILGAKRITDVLLGQYTEKNLTIMLVKVQDFSKTICDMKSDQIFGYMNKIFEQLSPIVRKHGGFVDRYEGSGFTAIFTDSKRALKASLEIHSGMTLFNESMSSKYPVTSLMVAIHSGEMLVGTVGERERLQCSIIGNHPSTVALLEKLARKFGTRILATKGAISSVSKLAKHVPQRMIGRATIENAKGSFDSVELYDVFKTSETKKMQNIKSFEEAVLLFQKRQYQAAITLFGTVLQSVPEDPVAQQYVHRCNHLVAECSYLGTSVTTKSLLADKTLRDAFEEFTKKEHSHENMLLWNQIEVFRTIPATERRSKAIQLCNDFLSLDGRYTININESLKLSVQQKLAQESNESVANNLFDGIQLELEIIMGDTLKRFKQSEAFLISFQQSSLAPHVPSVDEL